MVSNIFVRKFLFRYVFYRLKLRWLNIKIKSIFYVVSILLIFSSLSLSGISIENAPKTVVTGFFSIEMIHGTEFDISVELDVEKIVLTGRDTVYRSTDIEQLANENSLILGAIENELSVLISETLSESFKDAEVHAKNVLPTYQNNKFYDNFVVNLTAGFFDLNNSVNSYKLINGIIDMDANITYDMGLYAKKGWNNTYQFILSDDMALISANTANVDNDNSYITWILKNYDGDNERKDAYIKMHKKTSSMLKKEEDVFLEYAINSAASKASNLDIIANLNQVDITEYDVIPSFIEGLNYLPADGVRLFIENDLFSWNELKEKTLDDIKQLIVENIESSKFNQSLDLLFEWNEDTTSNSSTPYNLNNMDKNPPVKAIFKDNYVNIKILDINSPAVFGLINSGAVVDIQQTSINFGDKLNKTGYDYNISLLMPEGIKINGKNPFTWDDPSEFSGEITSIDPPEYFEEKISTIIEVEIENVDLNFLSFFTAKPEISFEIKMIQEKNYNITKLPSVFSLPEEISIDFLNSDALRVCIQEDVFKQDEIERLLTRDKNFFEKIAKQTIEDINPKANVDRNTFEDSLSWNQDINDMGYENPVKTSAYSYLSKSERLDIDIVPPDVQIPSQRYNFSGATNQTVIYKIIYPKGLNINANDGYDKAIVKETEDGRQYLEIRFSPDEADMSVETNCAITPSTIFLIGLFTPCIISIFITILLLAVLVLLRKKRGGRRRGVKQREPVYEERNGGYEDQDYYIPPPPGSK